MAAYERYEKWARWKGSLPDIVTLAKLMSDKAQTIAKSPVGLTILQGKANSTTEYDSVQEFEDEFAQSEADATKTLTLKVLEKGDTTSPLTAEVVLSRETEQPGAKIVIRGMRPEADALFAPVEERMLRGRRRMQLGQGGVYFVSMIALVLALAAWYAVLPFIELPEMSSTAATVVTIVATLLGAVVGGLIVGGTGFALNWLVPQLELVGDDGTTRWSRARKWVVVTVGTVILAPVIGAVAVNLVTGGD